MTCRCGNPACAQDLDPDAPTPGAGFRRYVLGQAGERIDLTTAGDAYPFTTGPRTADCKVCKGTGEVVDYPPDDDERLIACGHCGGTGELTR